MVTGMSAASATPTGCSLPVTTNEYGIQSVVGRCTSGTGSYSVYFSCYNASTGQLGAPIYTDRVKIGGYTYGHCIASIPKFYVWPEMIKYNT